MEQKTIYFAPLEGINGYVYRNVHHSLFGGVDKYFTPFIAPKKERCLSSREKRDILPENNLGMYVVPQLLTNRADYFIRAARELQEYGYEEVNLNLGCPSKTVVTKGKGAGFLADTDGLDAFLEQIFTALSCRISIKTRIGIDTPDEFEKLLHIYNKYPLHELIIHPRLQTDYYKNTPDQGVFVWASEHSSNRLCYNGDIFTAVQYQSLMEKYPWISCVMLGRGFLMNPGLGEALRGGGTVDREKLTLFLDRLCASYREMLHGERDVLFKMKELWGFMIHLFSDSEKYLKKIRKAGRLYDYEEAVKALLAEREIVI